MEELKPGRELDALIAEKVMGLKLESCKPFSVSSIGGPGGHWAPYYSTDIAAAWEVFGRLEGAIISKWYGKWCCSNACTEMWGCYFDEPEETLNQLLNYRDYFTQADTAPHAICLAALKAVEK